MYLYIKGKKVEEKSLKKNIRNFFPCDPQVTHACPQKFHSVQPFGRL